MTSELFPSEILQLEKPSFLQSVPVEPRLRAAAINTRVGHYAFVILGGPSAVGKSSLLLKATTGARSFCRLKRITTRPKRRGETDCEYDFVTRQHFYELQSTNRLIYSECYEGNSQLYGVRLADCQRALLTLSNKGCESFGTVGTPLLTRVLPASIFIYVLPPSMPELRRRAEEAERQDIDALLQYAEREIQAARAFAEWAGASGFPFALLVNESGKLEEVAQELVHIVAHASPRKAQTG